MLGAPLLRASRSPYVRELVTTLPATRRIVDRFVAGETLASAVAVAEYLVSSGVLVTLDHLGEDVLDEQQAAQTRNAYCALLGLLAAKEVTARAEVSIKLSAMGLALPGDGARIALDNAYAVCQAAERAGTTVTIDMEDHTTVDSTLEILGKLRSEFSWVGVALQSSLYRTETDCAELAASGARVRLVKGAYAEPVSVAHQAKHDVDLAFMRCLRTLMVSHAYPMIATHDLRIMTIARSLASLLNRPTDTYEFQMLHGVRAREQRLLADAGQRVRVYVPFGGDWYGYFTRRLAERPANLGFFLRAVLTR